MLAILLMLVADVPMPVLPELPAAVALECPCPSPCECSLVDGCGCKAWPVITTQKPGISAASGDKAGVSVASDPPSLFTPVVHEAIAGPPRPQVAKPAPVFKSYVPAASGCANGQCGKPARRGLFGRR